MTPEITAFTQTAISLLTTVGLKVMGAIILWFAGKAAIRVTVAFAGRALDRRALDATIVNWLRSSLGAVLMVALIVAMLSLFGVETTSFAALLAGAGLAIGAAWSGLLSNFASGVFLIILRPFSVGDAVSVAGVAGRVRNIGMFGTTIDAPDNVQTIVANSRIFSETIQNFSANPHRRIELTARLDHSADHVKAIELLGAAIRCIPNVCAEPEPGIGILSLDSTGPVLTVRPYAPSEHYWQVYFDTNRVIRETLRAGGFGVPGEYYYDVAVESPARPADLRTVPGPIA